MAVTGASRERGTTCQTEGDRWGCTPSEVRLDLSETILSAYRGREAADYRSERLGGTTSNRSGGWGARLECRADEEVSRDPVQDKAEGCSWVPIIPCSESDSETTRTEEEGEQGDGEATAICPRSELLPVRGLIRSVPR